MVKIGEHCRVNISLSGMVCGFLELSVERFSSHPHRSDHVTLFGMHRTFEKPREVHLLSPASSIRLCARLQSALWERAERITFYGNGSSRIDVGVFQRQGSRSRTVFNASLEVGKLYSSCRGRASSSLRCP